MPVNPGKKRERVIAALTANPALSNRAIAKLAAVVPTTVATVRHELGLASPTLRREASGRRARGPLPALPRDPDPVPGAAVYRCYGVRDRNSLAPLLYIGLSLPTIERAAHDGDWWPEIAVIRITHYPTVIRAQKAESNAIRDENPIYNNTGNLSKAEREQLHIAHRHYRREMRRLRDQQRIAARIRRADIKPPSEPLRHVAAPIMRPVMPQLEARKQTALRRYTLMQQQAAARATRPPIQRPRTTPHPPQ